MRWDPDQYARFAGPRSRPFRDLVAQIGAEAPRVVVDLGCGPGELTVHLADRWPGASVRGVDSSPEMIAKAPTGSRVQFSLGTAEEFDATGVDILVSNAVLPWVPTHRDLLVHWAGRLNPGGWLAFAVPSNFGAPSHRRLRELAESPEWSDRLAEALDAHSAQQFSRQYADLLRQAYPERPYGTPFGFLRTFAVARLP